MESIQKSLFAIEPERAQLLGPQNTAEIQRLLELCADYFDLVEGIQPGPQLAREVMTDRPPTKRAEDKLLVGVYTPENQLIALIEGIRGYPAPGMWWIGLMLVDPPRRGVGLGARVLQGFEDWAAHQGVWAIGIGVVEANEKALRFWQRMGYEVLEKTSPRLFGEREHAVFRMRKVIG